MGILSRPRLWLWGPAAAVILSSCSSDSRASSTRSARVTTTVSSTTTTTVVTTTTTAVPPPPPGLGPGATGPAVLDLEQRLAALRYEVGAVDGSYDQNTAHGVTAFQKVTGMPRSGRATDDVVAAVTATNAPPPALVPAGGPNRVEIDLGRQVLFLFEGDSLSKVLPVSTGSGSRFCSEGWCRRAVTPTGSYRIYSQRRGWERSPLGRLYNSQYFVDGIAIHGSPSVPPHPASHGCVRIPMSASEWFPSKVSMGTPVYVAGSAGSPPPPLPAVPPPAAAPAAPPAQGAAPQAVSPGTVNTLAPPMSFVPQATTVTTLRPNG